MSVSRWLLTALSFAVMFGASAWVVTTNWPAGGMPLLGSVSTSGTEGGQAFTATESWRAYKSHPVLNEVVVDGQGQAGAAFQVTHGQFTVRDDFNPALSINRLLN